MSIAPSPTTARAILGVGILVYGAALGALSHAQLASHGLLLTVGQFAGGIVVGLLAAFAIVRWSR